MPRKRLPRFIAEGSFFSAYYFPNAAWARSTSVVFTAARSSCYPVGYTTKGSVENAKFYILSSQFESVAGGRNVQDIVGGVTPVEYDDEFKFRDTATQIQIPNTLGGYDTIYYINGAADVDEQGNDVYDKIGWADLDGNYIGGEYDGTDLKGVIPAGLAFWYKNLNNDTDWTHSGAVPSTDKPKRVDFPNNNFCLRSNPFPVTFNINDAKVDSSEILPVDYDDEFQFRDTATQIQIPNTLGGYDTIYYINGAADVDEQGNDVYDKIGWADLDGNYIGGAYDGTDLKGIIPVMQGFWTKGVNGASAITFGL